MNTMIFILALLSLLMPQSVETVGGDCTIDEVQPYTGEGTIEWQSYPNNGVEYFATMNLLDTKTGEGRFYETKGWRTFEGNMWFPFQLERGHLWKISNVSCYIVYPSGKSDISPDNSMTWYVDTRYKVWVPILRR